MNDLTIFVAGSVALWGLLGMVGLYQAARLRGSDPPRAAWAASVVLGPLVGAFAWYGRRRAQRVLEDFMQDEG